MLTGLRRRLARARLADPAFAFLFDEEPAGEAVVIDCETTGLDVRADDIVSVAAVPIRGDRLCTSERFEALVRPRTALKADAIRIHHLRATDVAEARPIEEVLPDLLRFLGPRPLVGYYIDFDVRMIDRYARHMLGVALPNRRIEVSELYYAVKYRGAPPGTTLDLRFEAIRRDLGIPPLPQHDATNDAVLTGMMYLNLRDMKERGATLQRDRAAPGFMPPVGG